MRVHGHLIKPSAKQKLCLMRVDMRERERKKRENDMRWRLLSRRYDVRSWGRVPREDPMMERGCRQRARNLLRQRLFVFLLMRGKIAGGWPNDTLTCGSYLFLKENIHCMWYACIVYTFLCSVVGQFGGIWYACMETLSLVQWQTQFVLTPPTASTAIHKFQLVTVTMPLRLFIRFIHLISMRSVCRGMQMLFEPRIMSNY